MEGVGELVVMVGNVTRHRGKYKIAKNMNSGKRRNNKIKRKSKINLLYDIRFVYNCLAEKD